MELIILQVSTSKGSNSINKNKIGFFQRNFEVLYKEKALWLLLLPGIIWYLIFAYGPMYGLIISFKDFSPFKGIVKSPWVGFMWFEQFFKSQFFWRLIKNTLLLNIYNIIFGFPIPIILAFMLNEVQHNWYKRIAQTISYLPHFVSTVIVIGMLVNFVSPTGIINSMIKSLGGETVHFMVKPQWFRPLYIITGIWQSAGWSSIIYIAALSGIDPQLYEAAIVDGANKIKQIWYVSLPGIMPTILIMLILALGSILSIGYEKIILMYNTATYETADVINTYVYRRGVVGGEYSFGTAVGLFQSIINFIFIVIANKISRKVSEVSLW